MQLTPRVFFFSFMADQAPGGKSIRVSRRGKCLGNFLFCACVYACLLVHRVFVARACAERLCVCVLARERECVTVNSSGEREIFKLILCVA